MLFGWLAGAAKTAMEVWASDTMKALLKKLPWGLLALGLAILAVVYSEEWRWWREWPDLFLALLAIVVCGLALGFRLAGAVGQIEARFTPVIAREVGAGGVSSLAFRVVIRILNPTRKTLRIEGVRLGSAAWVETRMGEVHVTHAFESRIVEWWVNANRKVDPIAATPPSEERGLDPKKTIPAMGSAQLWVVIVPDTVPELPFSADLGEVILTMTGGKEFTISFDDEPFHRKRW